LSLVIFRLIQECLTNVLRHSESKIAVIRLASNAESVTVEVEDHGRGIPAERLAAIESHGAGVGIQGMRERVRHFAGDIKIESSGRGTKISATLPIPRKSRASDEPAELQKRAGL
jgi:signal transduction histidine kinase